MRLPYFHHYASLLFSYCILTGLDTGDLVLFDRPCSKMGSIIGIVCSTAKVVGGSPFDHIGVVVRIFLEPSRC